MKIGRLSFLHWIYLLPFCKLMDHMYTVLILVSLVYSINPQIYSKVIAVGSSLSGPISLWCSLESSGGKWGWMWSVPFLKDHSPVLPVGQRLKTVASYGMAGMTTPGQTPPPKGQPHHSGKLSFTLPLSTPALPKQTPSGLGLLFNSS